MTIKTDLVLAITIAAISLHAEDLTVNGNLDVIGKVGIGTNPTSYLDVSAPSPFIQPVTNSRIMGNFWGGTDLNTEYAVSLGYSMVNLHEPETVGLNLFYNLRDGTPAGEKEGGLQLVYRRNDGMSAVAGGKILFKKESGSNSSSIRFFTNDNTERLTLLNNGFVGIGTISPQHELAVNGTIQSKEVIVEAGWPDFVFENEYHLKSLDEVEDHIEEHGHLPGVPSAAMVESEGLSVGEAQKIMMQKIEELTLYVIDLQKQNDSHLARINELESKLSQQNARYNFE